MNRQHLILTCLGLLALPAAGLAQDRPQLSFNLGAVSDYVFRGVSQTGAYDPAIQGGADLGYGRAYAGVWASNVKFGDGADAEVDLYGGFRPRLAGLDLDLGGILYAYPGAPRASDETYFEFKAAASHPLGKATLGGAIYYSPDFFGPGSLAATYYEASLSLPLTAGFTASGALGRQSIQGPGDYITWNAGVTWAATPRIAVDLRYWDTDRHSFGQSYGPRAVVGLKTAF